MIARLLFEDREPMEVKLPEAFIYTPYIEILDPRITGYFARRSIEDDGTRVYERVADSLLDWLAKREAGGG